MQAARGTSVDHSESGSDASRPAVTRARVVFAGVALVLYGLDQWSKHAAVDHLSGRESDLRVVGDLLQLHLTRNPGAAFSLGTEFTVVLSCLAIVATLVVLRYSLRLRDGLWAAALGSMLAGTTGNLTDRLLRAPGPFRGHVIDFLQVPNWPVFNIADIAINVGAVLVLVQVFRGVRMDGTRHAHDDADPGEDPLDPEARP